MTEIFAADDDVAYAARVRGGGVGSLGGAFFLSAQARQAGKDLGLRGWPTLLRRAMWSSRARRGRRRHRRVWVLS